MRRCLRYDEAEVKDRGRGHISVMTSTEDGSPRCGHAGCTLPGYTLLHDLPVLATSAVLAEQRGAMDPPAMEGRPGPPVLA